MADLTFNKLADAPVLDKVPDGAKVYAEVDGKVYRVAGDNLGGGVPTAIIELTAGNQLEEMSMTAEETDGDSPAPAAETGTESRSARDISNITGKCTNMTYAEAKAILTAGKPLMAVVTNNENGYHYGVVCPGILYNPEMEMIELHVDDGYLYWYSDETISN